MRKREILVLSLVLLVLGCVAPDAHSQSSLLEKCDLPHVLIIGDSISMGYAPFVTKELKGVAHVTRHKGNAGPTIRGLEKIEDWLGETRWSVIHFNWGLWDMYGWEYADDDRSPDAYRKRLEKLVARLEKTGAVLIWGTTTPACPAAESTMRKRFDTELVITPEVEKRYLDTALEVMKDHRIKVNNLHALMKPELSRYALGPDDVHYTKEGYEVLGRKVAEAIRDTLSARDGLILDLDADLGVEVEEGDRVVKWVNQEKGFAARDFVKRDEGRKVPGSGRPTLKTDVKEIGGRNTVVFKRQELVNHDEDAFDHLITGGGHTWFAVMSVYEQVAKLKDVNSIFGNLKNGGYFEGIWGNLTDDNRLWIGGRNGLSFGRWDDNNPMVLVDEPLERGRYYVIAGRMGAGTDVVKIEAFVNDPRPVAIKSFPVNRKADSSKMVIGQERDAIQHPGHEAFDGELARLLIYDRALSDEELKRRLDHLKSAYLIDERK